MRSMQPQATYVEMRSHDMQETTAIFGHDELECASMQSGWNGWKMKYDQM